MPNSSHALPKTVSSLLCKVWSRLAAPFRTSAAQATRTPHETGVDAHAEALESRLLLSAGGLIRVTTTADVVDADDGVTSLREAILTANAENSQEWVIRLEEDTYFLTRTGNDDTAQEGDLDITNQPGVTIIGEGAGATIDASDGSGSDVLNDRLFDVHTDGQLSIHNLTLTGGRRNGSGLDGSGGAIRVDTGGEVRIADSTLTGNEAGAAGGAIANLGGTVNITRSDITSNSTTIGGAEGGAIFTRIGHLTVNRSTFSSNVSGGDGGAIHIQSGTATVSESTLAANQGHSGGAIDNRGSLTIESSTLSQNIATSGSGGGIVNRGTLSVAQTTLSGNTATGDGGGIANGGTLTVTHSTLTRNRGNSDGNATGTGGGIFTGTGSTTLSHTIVAGNVTGTGNTPSDLAGEAVAAGSDHNLIGDPDSSGSIFDDEDGNIVGETNDSGILVTRRIGDILDTTLADNGGPTQTHALVDGSAAINAGDRNFARDPERDQRGVERVMNGRVDIGAVESQGEIRVTTTDDVIDWEDGERSLREAIILANENPADDTIVLEEDVTYNLTIQGNTDNRALTGDLDVRNNGSLTLIGNGATIDGGGQAGVNDRIIHLHWDATLEVQNLTITGGRAHGGPDISQGGGIFSHVGNLSIIGSTISGNTATGDGGGINVRSNRVVTITNSTISGNTAGPRGGGIYSSTSFGLEITDSTISGNTAEEGGGIHSNEDVVTLTNVTVSGNSASLDGGGVYTYGGILNLTNSTISGNSADRNGGGHFNDELGWFSAANSTIALNRADADGDADGSGGGLFLEDGDGSRRMDNTIIAGNLRGVGGNETPDDISSDFLAGSHNLIGDAATSGGRTDGVSGNIVGANVEDVLETTLADNGGPTLTHALVDGSAAIDAGNPNITPGSQRDQRGFERMLGGRVDIGAVESYGPHVVTTTEDVIDANDGELSLREAIILANEDSADDTIVLEENATYHLTIQGNNENHALTGDLDIRDNGSLTLIGNGATIDGDGQAGLKDRIFQVHSDAILKAQDLTVTGGRASGGTGGGFRVDPDGDLSLLRVTVDGNIAVHGGGVDNEGSLTVEDSLFSQNRATGNHGGGLRNLRGTAVIINSTFSRNWADLEGGAIYHGGSTPTNTTITHITNSTISENTAIYYGGGIQASGGRMTVTNSTIILNRITSTSGIFGGRSLGGGILAGDDIVLSNSIVAGNRRGAVGADFANDISRSVTGTHNLIGDAATSGGLTDGVDGNIVGANVEDVLNLTLADNGGPTLTHALVDGSAAIDAGDPSITPESQRDQRGFERVLGGRVDIGAVESYGPHVVTTTEDVIDWEDGLRSLREAIILANENPADDTIVLASGETYVLTIQGNTDDDALTGDLDIQNNGSLTLIGNGATIDGGGQAGLNDRILHLLPLATLDVHNLTITGGRAHGGSSSTNSGGGIHTSSGSLTLFDSTISGNTATGDGGGISTDTNQTVTITNSTISENTADQRGGGIYSYFGALEAFDSTISGNTARDGGGIYNDEGSATLKGVTISGNSASRDGGGVYTNAAILSLINATLSGNSADRNGGGHFNEEFGRFSAANSTIVMNRADADGDADGSGGGLFLEENDRSRSANNTLIAGNLRGVGGNETPDDISDDSLDGTHNLIGDAATSGGLTDGVEGNLVGHDVSDIIDLNLTGNGGPTRTHALLLTSAAVNAGDNGFATIDGQIWSTPLEFDQRGEAFGRVQFGTVDIGAFELRTYPASSVVGISEGQWFLSVSDGTTFTTTQSGGAADIASGTDVVTGDFNGDGFTDYAARNGGAWQVALSDGTAFTASHWGNWSNNVTWVDVVAGDFNGDGRTDIAGRVESTGNWWVSTSHGDHFVLTYWGGWSNAVIWKDVATGDFNGDGLDDIAGRANGNWWVAGSQGSRFASSFYGRWSDSVTWIDVSFADFNGDGLDDIAGRVETTSNWWVALSSGASFASQLFARWDAATEWLNVSVGDFNGDGMSDIAARTAGRWQVSLSTGTAFEMADWGGWSDEVTWVDAVVGDFNLDGRADIAGRRDNGNWWISLSQGDRFEVSHFGAWRSTSGNFDHVAGGSFSA